jgi:hypothetical protein
VTESKIFKLRPDETVLEDDYPIVSMYVYICDNRFTRFEFLEDDFTVAAWKRRAGFKEIRRCHLFGHEGARLGDRVEP